MTLEQLYENIAKWNIPAAYYSINEGLKPDAFILDDNHGIWTIFYLSEKGERSESEYFKSSDEAYDYLWEKLYKMTKYSSNIPPPKNEWFYK